MVGWWLFASSMNEYISSLSTFHNENMSSINLFHTSGLCGLFAHPRKGHVKEYKIRLLE